MEVTLNKLEKVGVQRYNEVRYEAFIGDYFLGIIKERALCRPCNIWGAYLFMPNKKGAYRLDRKDLIGSVKKIAEKMNIETTK